MSFKENINRICKEQGTTLTALVKSMGLSTSKVSRWNEGALPKEELMVMLANKLNCSVMDFFADEEDLDPAPPNPRDEDEEDILRVYRALSRRNKHEIMSMVYEFEARKELEGDSGNSAAV